MYSNQSKKRTIFLSIALISLSLVIAGCSNSASSNTEAESASDAESQIITHAMGTTEIKGTPQRVVTLYQGANDAAVALGVTPVGIVESWDEQPVYNYLTEELGEVPIVGQETQPNLEEIAKLKPDLIIASKIRHEEVYEQLSAIAPTIAHETVFVFKDTVNLMGQALHKETEAQEVIEDWDNRVIDFKEKLEVKMGDEAPEHVAVLNFRADHSRIYYTGFAGSILAELGFEGPKNMQDDSPDIIKLTDKESIIEMNADAFYIFMDKNDPAVVKTYEEWTNHPLWENLDAVKSNQVYEVDEIVWNLGGGIISANLMLDDMYDRFGLEK
ncbi:iron-siderophore ABC transporter substrate-binding protein [Planococcus sp. ANT_H30]|uniref:ABC transporter substrate-binding protein n=2 Tax=Planococcus TaxID=1372 RepID=UPI0009E98018|nr:iron-siderophore ABC transporter substrate-binding protein [Planococcus sp. ANT_H30]KAA0958147.1 iron-siderophore ABC transporter substrate-binding protein [Planococcus sp. ANT_H30]